jgi:histidine triad (HIT) family protein
MDCIFCKIINKEIPSDIIYEDENTLAILDLRPVNRGHALVMPKKHTADFLSTDDDTLIKTTLAAKKVAEAVGKATTAAGLNISTNNGAAAGQVIFHLHYHIIPRFQSDGLTPWPHHESEPKTRKELAETIKKVLYNA